MRSSARATEEGALLLAPPASQLVTMQFIRHLSCCVVTWLCKYCHSACT